MGRGRLILSSDQGYVLQNPDGNFVARKGSTNNPKHPDEHFLSISRQKFAWAFGRIPPTGLTIRADVFFRLCRLSNLVLFFSSSVDIPRNTVDGAYSTKRAVPMIKVYPSPDEDPRALFLNDEGNFCLNLASRNDKLSGWTLPVESETFEEMFGNDPRDYFANEVVRLTSLKGFDLKVVCSEKQ